MTEPTEAEVEAAAKAIHDVNCRPDPIGLKFSQLVRDMARAALTAAAQVRERTEQIPPLTNADYRALLDHVSKCPVPPLMPIYGATEDPAEHPGQRLVNEYMNSQGLRVADETEPTEDQGPDVLGMRKGEE